MLLTCHASATNSDKTERNGWVSGAWNLNEWLGTLTLTSALLSKDQIDRKQGWRLKQSVSKVPKQNWAFCFEKDHFRLNACFQGCDSMFYKNYFYGYLAELLSNCQPPFRALKGISRSECPKPHLWSVLLQSVNFQVSQISNWPQFIGGIPQYHP